MLGLKLVGASRPINPYELPPAMPTEYVTLLSTWGAGWLLEHVEFPDPRQPDGLHAELQARFRIHVDHQRAMGRWRLADDIVATAVMVGRARNGIGWLATRDGFVLLTHDSAQVMPSIAGWLEGLRYRPEGQLPRTYRAQPSRRGELYAALRDGDEATADRLLPIVFEEEHAAGMLEVACELVTGELGIAAEARADAFDRCLTLARRARAAGVAELPVREIRDAIRGGAVVASEHVRALEAVVAVEGVFHGPTTDVERQLAPEVVGAAEARRAACTVLADHLETIGQPLRAKLLREQAESLPHAEVVARGLASHIPVDADAIVGRWIERWRQDDPATSIDELVAIVMRHPPQVKQAIVSAIIRRDTEQLAGEPTAYAFAALGVREVEIEDCLAVIVELELAAAAPWLLAAIRTPTFVKLRYCDGRRVPDGGHDLREQLAIAFHAAKGKLSKADVTEVLSWLSREYGLRVAALCLLQRSAKDERVFEGYLAHFAEGHPYSERAIARRRTDPRVLPALHAAFDEVEKTALVGGRKVVYTEDYRVLARYLAKLGDPRGKAAWERAKLKGRIDRAESDREGRREGWD